MNNVTVLFIEGFCLTVSLFVNYITLCLNKSLQCSEMIWNKSLIYLDWNLCYFVVSGHLWMTQKIVCKRSKNRTWEHFLPTQNLANYSGKLLHSWNSTNWRRFSINILAKASDAQFINVPWRFLNKQNKGSAVNSQFYGLSPRSFASRVLWRHPRSANSNKAEFFYLSHYLLTVNCTYHVLYNISQKK